MSGLKRALSFWQATMFGIGLILGAGIYVVIGRTAAYAGDAVWLSVVVAGLVAFLTGLSYAELAGMYPKASSSYFYVKEAFPYKEKLAFLVGWMIFFEAASGASTAAIGFSHYFTELLKMSPAWFLLASAIFLIMVMTIVNWLGIEESSTLNIVFTLIELSGLLMVIALGFLYGSNSPAYFSPPPRGFMGVLQGASLIFFAYVGFELMATTSEETIEAKRTMPKAILAALAICGLVYLLVALSVVRLLPWEKLSLSGAPLAEAVEQVLGQKGWLLLSSIALFATSNTVLGFLVSSSRIAYGMAADGMLHKKLAKVHPKRRTPHYAIILASFVAIIEVLLASVSGMEVIDVVAKASNLGCLIAFIFVNLSVVILRLRRKDLERPFKIPLAVKDVPIPPLLGSILCAVIIVLTFHELVVWIITLLILGLGIMLSYALR